VSSFGGVPTVDPFVKKYELHYQLKRVQVHDDTLDAQLGCLNFHVKRYKDNGPKLFLAVKNKWSVGWTKAWFYCRVPVHQISKGGKNIHALYSCMSVLNYQVEPLMNCPDTESNDAALVKATTMIGGRDAVEEFLACGLYHLSIGFGFGDVFDGETAVSKVMEPLPKFPVAQIEGENSYQFLVKADQDAERTAGSYSPKEHEACASAKLPNGGRLNRIFKQMGIAYVPHQALGTEASAAATQKRKPDTSSEIVRKKAKVALAKKAGIVKIIWLKVKASAKGLSEIELALSKPLKVIRSSPFQGHLPHHRANVMLRLQPGVKVASALAGVS
jgi:hypothetical protein